MSSVDTWGFNIQGHCIKRDPKDKPYRYYFIVKGMVLKKNRKLLFFKQTLGIFVTCVHSTLPYTKQKQAQGTVETSVMHWQNFIDTIK